MFPSRCKVGNSAVKSERKGIERIVHQVPVKREHLGTPVAFREKTRFTISCAAYVAAGNADADKEEKIKVLVDAGCSTSSKCKHGRAGELAGEAGVQARA